MQVLGKALSRSFMIIQVCTYKLLFSKFLHFFYCFHFFGAELQDLNCLFCLYVRILVAPPPKDARGIKHHALTVISLPPNSFSPKNEVYGRLMHSNMYQNGGGRGRRTPRRVMNQGARPLSWLWSAKKKKDVRPFFGNCCVFRRGENDEGGGGKKSSLLMKISFPSCAVNSF